MRAREVTSLTRYAALLAADDAEAACLLHTLSVRVTGFFRNPDTWLRLGELLRRELPHEGPGPRAWCMGCATGEEAWSLAMLLRTLRGRAPPPAVRGSDVDEAALDTARAGRYPAAAADAIHAVLRVPQGTVREGHFEVDPALRSLVSFVREDLTRADPARGAFDLALCRNMLIFLGREGQRRVIGAAVQALCPGGLLVLGRAESLLAMPDAPLERVDAAHRIYRRAG
jgi:chemotaxis methyl-accepting protein methylase